MKIKTWAAALAITSLAACSSGPKDSAQPLATSEPVATGSDMGTEPTPVPTSTATTDAASIPTTPPVAAPEPAADITVVPMKMVFDAKKGMTAEVKADKTIWIKGKKIGAFDKNALVVDEPAGSIAVMKDGSINITPSGDMSKKVKLSDKDDLLVENGAKLSIDDKGKVTLLGPDGKSDPKTPAPAITGFKPEARRAGVLLSILWMTATTEGPKSTPATTSSTAPASTATPAASAAPAPKK